MSDDAQKCPHCGGELHWNAVARLAASSKVRFALRPAEKERFNARNIGESITQMGKLFKSIGNEQGLNVETLIDNISTAEDGTINIDMIIARFERKQKRGESTNAPVV